MEQLIKKASILTEALPYIERFRGKTFVVKYGGHAMHQRLKEEVMKDLTLLKFIGINVVVVHGGGPMISAMLDKLGIPSYFSGGLRVTDDAAMEVVEMVLSGQINKELVSLLNREQVKAVGISGKDASTIKARSVARELGRVGQIVGVNPGLLQILLKEGYLPVVAPVGVGDNGESYNINADDVAAEIAGALQAEKLIYLTDVDGIRKDKDDPASRYSRLEPEQVYTLLAGNEVSGGMIPKVYSSLKALELGVQQVHIIDGQVPHCLLLEIFTDQGIGTMLSTAVS